MNWGVWLLITAVFFAFMFLPVHSGEPGLFEAMIHVLVQAAAP